VSPDQLPGRLSALLDERRRLERETGELRRKLASGGGAAANDEDVREVAGMKFAAKVLDGIPAKDLKPLADELKKRIGSGVVVLVAVNEGKASLVVGVTDDATGKASAVDLVKIGSEALGGKGGGGRPDMAQAGGPDGAAAPKAIEAIEAALAAS
jgi:alanyl-tRNA synthetase